MFAWKVVEHPESGLTSLQDCHERNHIIWHRCWQMMAGKGTSDAIQAGSFEQVKSDMELALGKHIEKLLGERSEDKSEHAA